MSTPENPQDPYGQQPSSGDSGAQGGYGTPGGYSAPQGGYQAPQGGYEAPAGGYNAPPPPSYGAAGGTPPQNYLVWAILTTLFCCLPLGVASIVFSTQVNSKWSMGDVAGAHDASAKAKKFAIWAAIAGVIGAVLYIALLAAGVIAGGGFETTSY